MAQVDDFLRQHVAAGLEPGESILGVGLMRRLRSSGSGGHQSWEDFFGVATDRRLIVFDTETGGIITPTAKPVARSPVVWRYDELSRVGVQPVFGLTTGLSLFVGCHPYLGPYAAEQDPNDAAGVGRRYDIFASCDGLDGQAAFHGQFPTWLDQRVNGGAFPLPPEKRAWVESKIAERRAVVAAEQQRVLQHAAERDAKIRAGVEAVRGAWQSKGGAVISIASLVAVILVGLAGAATGALFVADAVERLGRDSSREDFKKARAKLLEADVASWAGAPAGQPPTDCPEENWPKSWRRFSSDDRKKCHGCVVETTKPYPQSGGYRTFERGGAFWTCPPSENYRADLATAKRDVRDTEDNHEKYKLQLGLAAAGALVGLLLIPLGLLVRKKLLRGAPSRTPPVLGAPGAHG